MTDDPRDTSAARLQGGTLIRGAVIHLLNEQPLVADLLGYPTAGDATVVCTNVRGTTGKRPIWADHADSIFYFPWIQIRFMEVPPDRSAPLPAQAPGTAVAVRAAAEEPELEIDEEFLRRVRDA
jgi:hypothetical protein